MSGKVGQWGQRRYGNQFLAQLVELGHAGLGLTADPNPAIWPNLAELGHAGLGLTADPNLAIWPNLVELGRDG